MADDTSVTTPDTGDSSQYQGISSPPNGGNVSTIDTPPSEMQGGTPAPQSQPAPSQGQSASTPSDDGTGGPQQSGQAPQSSQAPQGPQPGQKAPQQPRTPSDGGTGGSGAPPVHPAVARAGILSQVAQALAGGPRTTYKINPETGEMVKTQVPLSGRQIGMAIALEALSGSITGLAQQGPNATAKAAAAGFQQAQQQQQEKDQQAQKMATADYARHAQILETNMRMRSMALQVGKQGIEAHNDYIGQFSPIAEKIQRDHPEAVYGTIHHSEFSKYNVTDDMAVPVKAVRRVNAQGQPVSDENGEPLWDDLYMVFKPGFKAEDLIPQGTLDSLKEQGHPFASNQLIGSTAQKASLAMGLTSQAAQYGLAKNAILDAQQILNGGTPKAPEANDLKDLEIKDPSINAALTPAVSKAAAAYKVDPVMLGKLAKGVIMQESGGNPNVADNTSSPKGPAAGPMQIIPGTAAQLGIKDVHDVNQNINGGVTYLAQQLAKYGDPMKAIAAYNGTGPDAQAYAKQVADRIGLGASTTSTPANPLEKPDWAALNKANPVLPSDMAKFQSAFSAANNSYGAALNHLALNDPESAGRIVNQFFGGDITNGQKVDQAKAGQVKSDQENIANENKLKYDTAKKNQEEQGIVARNANIIDALASGKNIDLSRIATMRAYDREIIVNKILDKNPNFNPASIDRAIKLADEAADESKTGSLGNSVRNVNTAFGHMGEAMDSINNLQKLEGRSFSDYTNKTKAWMDDHFGGNDPASQEYQRWKVSLNAAATDWQNLLNNQHALTETDKKLAETVANPNATFGNIQASLQEMARTGAIRTIPLNERWKETMHANYPNLIEPQTIDAIKKINDPVVTKYLGEMESGGDLVNGQYGVGSPGKKVSDLLNNSSQSQLLPGQRQGETPKYVNGQLVGYTMAGKSGMRPVAQPQGQ